MVKTIKIADYKTQRDIKFSVEGNAAKLDNITKFLESGGVLSNPDYGLEAIKTGINDAKKSVGDGKTKVAGAIATKGVPTAADSTFDTLAANIGQIVTLSSGSADATAGSGQILSGYTAYAKGSKVTGSMPSLGEQTIMPGTTAKAIPAGYYLSGQQTIAGDANLIPDNIIAGKSIFGVSGTAAPNKIEQGNLPGEDYAGYFIRPVLGTKIHVDDGIKFTLIYFAAQVKYFIALRPHFIYGYNAFDIAVCINEPNGTNSIVYNPTTKEFILDNIQGIHTDNRSEMKNYFRYMNIY